MPEGYAKRNHRDLAEENRLVLGVGLSRLGFAAIPSVYAASQPVLMREWDLSGSQAGWVHSVFIFCYMISMFYMGFLVDRFGAKRVYLSSCVLATLFTLLFALFARDFPTTIVLIGLAALVKGGVYTPMFNIFAQRIQPRRRGRAIGMFVAAGDAGNALSLILTSLILRVSNWRMAFLLSGIAPALGTLLVFWELRNTPNERPPAARDKFERSRIWSVLTNLPAMLNTWGYAWHNWELLGMRSWLPTFFAAIAGAGAVGSSRAASEGAILAGIMHLVAIAGNIVGGTLSDYWGRTRIILLMGTVSLVCSFTIGWLVSLPFWLLFVVALFYNFTAIGDSAALSTQMTEVVPARHLGAAFSVRSVLGFAPGVVSPWLFGWVIDHTHEATGTLGTTTWGLAFSFLGAGALLGPLGVFWLHMLSNRKGVHAMSQSQP